MYTLSKCQVQQIADDVENARITFSHLADDLIDHICCEVENEMYEGKSFDEAYEIVKQQTGIKTLQKIQENTQYLIDKNYRIMKMTMKITGNVSLALLALATLMKILHLPGASILLLLGFVILGLVFFPSALYTNYRDLEGRKSLALHLSIFIGGLLFMFGVLFKVLHWPGAGMLLIIGWVFILFIFLPLLLVKKYRQSETAKDKWIVTLGVVGLIVFELSTMFKLFHWPGAAVLMILGSIILVSVFLPLFTYSKFKQLKQITGEYIFLIIGTMFFILFSVLLALNASKDTLGTLVSDAKSSAAIVNYLEAKNQKFYGDFANASDSVKVKYGKQVDLMKKETQSLVYLIDSIKVEIIALAEGVEKSASKQLLGDVTLIGNKSSIDAVSKIMTGEKGAGVLLKNQINQYKIALVNAFPDNTNLANSISILLNTNAIDDGSGILNWEQINFDNQITIGALAFLSDLEKSVRLVESQVIGTICLKK
ncbi:MAG: hypothetical protein F9K37_13520 [Bacteroidales bacterium]|nr:MAG: hypothetical protein F9K37_13520 [Bacteroidales bacterium]